MKPVYYFLILLLLLGVVACRRDEDPEEIAGGGTFVPVLSQPLPVTLDQLASAPQTYLDQFIQLTGRYEPVAELICIDNPSRTSPATWSISDGNLVAQVGGFDEQVNELLPAGLEVTVDGYWRFWEGRVGCGKQTEITQVWYLEATNLVSPSPLVRITLTPSGEIALVDTPDPSLVATLPAGSATVVTPEIGNATPETSPGPAVSSETPPGVTPTPSRTPAPSGQPSMTPTPSISDTIVITATPTITASGTITANGTITATSTPTPTADGTASPSPTPSGSATPTPNADNIIVLGNISSQSLVVDTLTAGVGHQYSFALSAGDVISISLVMIPDDDPTFQVLDPDGDIVAQRNENPAGIAEDLIAFPVSESGTYAVVIREAGGNPADYAMTLGKETDTFILVFNGPLIYEQTGAVFIKENHLHYWHFFGESGDQITILVEPFGNADLAFRVRDPLLEFLDDDYTNEGAGGVAEEATFTLPATGLYTIDIEEWDFGSGDYQIVISLE